MAGDVPPQGFCLQVGPAGFHASAPGPGAIPPAEIFSAASAAAAQLGFGLGLARGTAGAAAGAGPALGGPAPEAGGGGGAARQQEPLGSKICSSYWLNPASILDNLAGTRTALLCGPASPCKVVEGSAGEQVRCFIFTGNPSATAATLHDAGLLLEATPVVQISRTSFSQLVARDGGQGAPACQVGRGPPCDSGDDIEIVAGTRAAFLCLPVSPSITAEEGSAADEVRCLVVTGSPAAVTATLHGVGLLPAAAPAAQAGLQDQPQPAARDGRLEAPAHGADGGQPHVRGGIAGVMAGACAALLYLPAGAPSAAGGGAAAEARCFIFMSSPAGVSALLCAAGLAAAAAPTDAGGASEAAATAAAAAGARRRCRQQHRGQCIVCLEREADIVVKGCRHLVVCKACRRALVHEARLRSGASTGGKNSKKNIGQRQLNTTHVSCPMCRSVGAMIPREEWKGDVFVAASWEDG